MAMIEERIQRTKMTHKYCFDGCKLHLRTMPYARRQLQWQ